MPSTSPVWMFSGIAPWNLVIRIRKIKLYIYIANGEMGAATIDSQ